MGGRNCGGMSYRSRTRSSRRHAVNLTIPTLLLGVYFGVLTLVSGWSFTVFQFAEFWPYIVTLALGFGTQVGLYLYLKQLSVHHHHARHMVAASGTTSTAAMLACCAHYLTNILPIFGASRDAQGCRIADRRCRRSWYPNLPMGPELAVRKALQTS